tara:strand:+ start:4043 stop:4675 length:633 start_codon:yes stop_codon:yes gene_type:complete
MATRQGIDSSIINALAEDNTFPFIAVKTFFDSGNVRVWSGNNDATIEGETYLGAGSLISIGDIAETAELSSNGISITISGMDSTVLNLALTENYQNRKIIVFLGFLDGGTDEVKGVLNAFTGRMVSMNILDSTDSSTIVINAENRLIDMKRPSKLRYTSESQKFISSTDTSFNRVMQMIDKEVVWGRKSATNSSLADDTDDVYGIHESGF